MIGKLLSVNQHMVVFTLQQNITATSTSNVTVALNIPADVSYNISVTAATSAGLGEVSPFVEITRGSGFVNYIFTRFDGAFANRLHLMLNHSISNL